MFVSVIIPSFNRPESTLRSIQSALSQSFAVGEVIVVDDASDPPLDSDRIEGLDSRVKCFRLERNGGASAARQHGIEHAQGDVVAFLDSDDLWDFNKLEWQISALQSASNSLTAVTCGWRERSPDGQIRRERTPITATSASDFARGCWFCPGSTVIAPRAVFAQVGRFDTRLRRLEDLDWFARFGLAGGTLCVVPQTLVEIEIGKRARGAIVEPAVETILKKSTWPRALSNRGRKDLLAWLDVELARAFLNDGRRMMACFHFARSFVRAPRTRLQLRDWWGSVS